MESATKREREVVGISQTGTEPVVVQQEVTRLDLSLVHQVAPNSQTQCFVASFPTVTLAELSAVVTAWNLLPIFNEAGLSTVTAAPITSSGNLVTSMTGVSHLLPNTVGRFATATMNALIQAGWTPPVSRMTVPIPSTQMPNNSNAETIRFGLHNNAPLPVAFSQIGALQNLVMALSS